MFDHPLLHQTRRHFLRDCSTGLGAMWLATAAPSFASTSHFAPRVKRVIYLHMAGGPSQLELFDHKPELRRFHGKDCPESLIAGKKFAFIQGVPKLLGPQFPFQQHGQSGQWFSDRLPHLAELADDLCFIKSMHTDEFNHGPAQLMMHTGSSIPGSASAGAWATYGLGSDNQNLPGFIVLTSGGKVPDAGKSVWGSGYLPSVYQGVQCRSAGEPVLFLSNPESISRPQRRLMLDALAELNHAHAKEVGDPETITRIAQYEMAYRMQASATDAFDIRQESAATHAIYGTSPGAESFANNCLLARRLVERGVRFVQLFDWGWDSHGAFEYEAISHGFSSKCRQIDQPIAALLRDLKQRGLLDDTLVVWSGEFGRTPMQENRGGMVMPLVGRDHHPAAFTLWMAGAGVKPGYTHGSTDDLGYEAITDRVSPHDFHATLLHLLGFDHQRLTFPTNGINQRLTNVTKPGSRVVKGVLS